MVKIIYNKRCGLKKTERMFRLSKKRFKGIGILLLLTAIIFTISGCTKTESDEGLVARVNGEGITQEEFDADFEVYKMISIQQYGEDAMKQVGADGRTLEDMIKEDVLEKLIMEKLIEKEAKDQDVKVSEEEVKDSLDGYIAMLGGQEQYDEFLTANNVSRGYFEENIRKEMIFNKHRENFLDNSSVEEKESKEYFDEHKEDLAKVKAKHILLKTEAEGESTLARLHKGEKFDKLANELSVDKTSAEFGGDLGYFGKGDFIAEFEEAAFALEVGEMSNLVKTEVGYHIIYLEEKLEDYESLKDTIEDILKQNKYYDKIEELRENAKVKIF